MGDIFSIIRLCRYHTSWWSDWAVIATYWATFYRPLYALSLLIAFKMDYPCCFSLGGTSRFTRLPTKSIITSTTCQNFTYLRSVQVQRKQWMRWLCPVWPDWAIFLISWQQIFITKVAQMFIDFLGSCEKHLLFEVKLDRLLLGQLLEKLGLFYFYIWSHWLCPLPSSTT